MHLHKYEFFGLFYDSYEIGYMEFYGFKFYKAYLCKKCNKPKLKLISKSRYSSYANHKLKLKNTIAGGAKPIEHLYLEISKYRNEE